MKSEKELELELELVYANEETIKPGSVGTVSMPFRNLFMALDIEPKESQVVQVSHELSSGYVKSKFYNFGQKEATVKIYYQV